MTGTRSDPVVLDSGNAANATLISSAEFTSTGVSSWNAGNFTMPQDGLMVVLIQGRDATGADITNVTIGGVAATTYRLTDHATNVDKHVVATRRVTAGAQNVTVTFGANTAATCWMVMSVWYISGQTSDVPRDCVANVTGAATSMTMTGILSWGHSVTLYSFGADPITNPAWTGDSITTDVAFNAVGAGTAKWGAGHSQNTTPDLVIRSIGATWTGSCAGFMVYATFK